MVTRCCIYCLGILVIQLLSSCSDSQEVPEVSNIELSVQIDRWDLQLFELHSKRRNINLS